jgi:mitochondrial GTPase 1
MLKRGGVKDLQRASAWFIKWWREEGGLLSAAGANQSSQQRVGWGFDFEWDAVQGGEVDVIQTKMEECIDVYLRNTADEVRSGGATSKTQKRKQETAQRRLRREAKRLGRGR